MRAALFGILVATALISAVLTVAPLGRAETSLPGKLQDALQQRVAADNAADHGIFHDDVTAIVVPFFREGSTLAEIRHVLAEQRLLLQRFHGAPDHAGETIFVSRVKLASDVYAEVHAVLDFEFDGTDEATMHLRKVTGYLQASSM